MARKGKQISRKRKAQMPEEEEKQNELILEEVLSISGKNVEKADGSPPARLKRSANRPNAMATTQPKKLNVKKRSVSPSSLPSKQKKSTDKEDEEVTNTVVNEVKASDKGDPVPNLPEGWRRQVVVRKSGKSAGQIDIYFYSPDGIKLRSRPDVASYLKKHKSDLKIEEFDFSRTAKTTEAVVKKKAAAENSTVPKKKSKIVQEEKSKVGVESKDSAKNISTKVSKSSEKVSAEVPSVPDAEEKNDASGKANKAFPEEKNSMEKNDRQEEKKNSRDYNSTTRKRKTQLPEDEKQNEVLEVSNEKANGSSSARLKRSNRLNEIFTQPKNLNTNPKKSTDEDVEANAVVNVVKTSEKGEPVPNLPDGWKKEIVVRKSGERAGQIDIYFYSPDGIKLRSRPDVASYLKKHKSDLKIEEFDFSRTAKTTEAVVKKKAAAENSTVPKKKSKTVQEQRSKVGVDSKCSSENISTKVSKSSGKLSVKVPQKKNDAVGKASKILKKILQAKPKKLRR
ncbi:hypothetical protein AVEN_181636-1 [Araneus ventricosus]|uniref:MBD domain-containing protein n=1 Tax=Araneus ventricosus TaxID=182803 RepID=A0A4Y2CMV6_ARAVE|nr:hypothetical protein AVEN_181636-1 [Araneus ventricosus]